MKIWSMAYKDLLCQLRSPFAMLMMVAAPLLITGLLFLAFGGLINGESGLDVPKTSVVVVNLDRPSEHEGDFSAGEMLVRFLHSDDLSRLIVVSQMADQAAALESVNRGSHSVAIIIPEELTDSLLLGNGIQDTLEPEGALKSTILMYQDPTRTIGPGMVQEVISQVVDGFAGVTVARGVIQHTFTSAGLETPAGQHLALMDHYSIWAEQMGQARRQGAMPGIDFLYPSPAASVESEETSSLHNILHATMAAMMIFFVFFTGAYVAESIVIEDEEGTLSRLLTTPTPGSIILGGKCLSIVLILILQIFVLLVAGRLLFGVHWGRPESAAPLVLVQIVAAAGFGILLMSFVKNSRQAGPIMGGVLTLTGMLGGLFTTGLSQVPPALDRLSLLVPHGWALQGWRLVMQGAGPAEIALTCGVLMAVGMLCFAIGVLRMRRRFA